MAEYAFGDRGGRSEGLRKDSGYILVTWLNVSSRCVSNYPCLGVYISHKCFLNHGLVN